ncbi:ABC transporter permease [Arthrobacter crystallopoietes BAB-32]|uniref:ABC transporter permease n=1 Tax=Arthrobacter crystallopoietes BAB-32 TaxID=1246476 RepID=N1V4V6_9MICC|nr:ABC transporter permease [Arthrobacter crystallopoietes]EMY35054.1 ABC transporter permease [Arthrobacter crystallopoietes BAB-32]
MSVALEPTTAHGNRPGVPGAPEPGKPTHSARGTAAGKAAAALRRTPIGVWIAAALLAFLVLAAVVPSLLLRQDPYIIDPAAAFTAPSAEHWFGTDQNGRDVFSRVVAGTGQSLLLGLAATAIGLVLGGLLGITAGVSGKWLDSAICRFVEILFAFPGLLLALIVIAVSGTGVVTAAIAVGVGTAPGYARMLRTQTLQVIDAPYVETALSLGRSRAHILWHTIVPNVIRPLFVLATLGVGQAIVWASSLSFLGLGAQPPAAEWGAMLADGRNYLQVAWWIAAFPGIFITLAALTTTLVGRHLQQRLEAEV